MAKRLILPTVQDLIVSSGSGEVTIPLTEPGIPGRILTYIVIIGPGGAPTEKGVVEVEDVDNSIIISKDPLPGDPLVTLDFYNMELRVPMNGVYKLKLSSVNKDGTYKTYSVLEERPRNV